MQHYKLIDEHWITSVAPEESSKETLNWFSFNADEIEQLTSIQTLTGVAIHENHINACLNKEHLPKYENTSAYDVLIMSSISINKGGKPRFNSCTFFITDNTLISVLPKTWAHHKDLQDRLQQRAALSITGLLSVILNRNINEQLSTRLAYSQLIERWQEQLIEGEQKFRKWSEFFSFQKDINHFITQSEMQWEALGEWRDETNHELSNHEVIRYSSALEHLKRLFEHLKGVRVDSDNLLQIYFSLTQDKTNDIMRLLTVFSVTLLPLNLVTGIFGMNFTNVPFVDDRYGFWLGLGIMATLSLTTIAILKRLKWI